MRLSEHQKAYNGIMSRWIDAGCPRHRLSWWERFLSATYRFRRSLRRQWRHR